MNPALLTAVDSTNHVHLIIGSNPLAAARCTRSLEVGARPKVIVPENSLVHYTLEKRIANSEVDWLRRHFQDSDLSTLGRDEVDGVVDTVFITISSKDTIVPHISSLCRRLRIPVNVVDTPSLSTFTLLSTYADGPLQIGVTTSGKGCKLAARIRREVISSLPPGLGAACERLGALRRRIWEEDHVAAEDIVPSVPVLKKTDLHLEGEDETTGQGASFNKLVLADDIDAARSRRIRWLAQVCEYWPLRRLANITDADIDTIMKSYVASSVDIDSESATEGALGLNGHIKRGRIVLAGSGPGSPALLTVATQRAIESADIILADKLVPSPVLDLIPRRTPVHIARKFPGNAEAAQEELLSLGLEAARKGLFVLRLKQGDPYIYGRGGEEYTFFRAAGFEPVVLPGITSALSAPLFAQIPATQRAVSDQILICTGTGRKGAAPKPPTYNPTQTIVFLMALHRLTDLVGSLTAHMSPTSITPKTKSTNDPPAGIEKDQISTIHDADVEQHKIRIHDRNHATSQQWPLETPCAVIERASCPDQRVIRSTLAHICSAIEEEGSRPPGLLVVGKSCEVLKNLGGHRWVVEEGSPELPGSDLTGALVAVT